MFISQEYFDETLLESQELFDYSDEQAVVETISELKNGSGGADGTVSLDHLSLTHPHSEHGKSARMAQVQFRTAIREQAFDRAMEVLSSTRYSSRTTTKTITTVRNNDNDNNGMENDPNSTSTCINNENTNRNDDYDDDDDKKKQKPTTGSNSSSSMDKTFLLTCQSLLLQDGFLSSGPNDNNRSTTPSFSLGKFLSTFQENEPDDNTTKEDTTSVLQQLLQLLIVLVPESNRNHPLTQAIKGHMKRSLEMYWCSLYHQYPCLRCELVQWARVSCYAKEDNKKAFVQAALVYSLKQQKQQQQPQNGLELLLSTLPREFPTSVGGSDSVLYALTMEIFMLVTVLGQYQVSNNTVATASDPNNVASSQQQQQAPIVSSAHANVLELHKAGAVPRLHRLARQLCTESLSSSFSLEKPLATVLSSLRVLAIDNDIVQNMVAIGILETADTALASFVSTSSHVAAATLGLLRNLCANDEIKTNVCKRSLPYILQAMEQYKTSTTTKGMSQQQQTSSFFALVQEHGCGILAQMALREPQNAQSIVESNGVSYIVSAMKAYPNKVPLQRQGALAIRNIASRLPSSMHLIVLDCGVEYVLRDVASKHQGSVEEAYAALRDLGLPAILYNVDETGKAQTTQMFGSVQSNFRPVYDE